MHNVYDNGYGNGYTDIWYCLYTYVHCFHNKPMTKPVRGNVIIEDRTVFFDNIIIIGIAGMQPCGINII